MVARTGLDYYNERSLVNGVAVSSRLGWQQCLTTSSVPLVIASSAAIGWKGGLPPQSAERGPTGHMYKEDRTKGRIEKYA